MIEDRSYGILPVRKAKAGWEILLVHQRNGFWGFPKGHADEGETHKEAADRELLEETGYKVARYLTDQEFQERYQFTHNGTRIDKTVLFFLAEVEGQPAEPNDEVIEVRWISLEGAGSLLTYAEARKMLTEAKDFLSKGT